MLAFDTPGLEQSFVRRRAQQLVPQDLSWALFWIAITGLGTVKWLQSERDRLQDLPVIVLYGMWCPLLLYLICYRLEFYLRNRTTLLMMLRIGRTLTLMSQIHGWEALVLGGSMGEVPATPFGIYKQLSWKPFALMFSSLGFIIPMRAHLPFQLTFLLLKLRSSAQRCVAECAGGGMMCPGGLGSGGVGTGACSSVGQQACAAVAAAAGANSTTLWSAADAAGGCPARALQYYQIGVAWVRKAVPPVQLLPDSWRWGAGGCLPSCFAVHSWLQTSWGVLLPIALLWAWEERLRARELKLWRQQPIVQQAAAATAGQQQLQAQCSQDLPLSFPVMAAWVVGTSWLLWLLLEVTLLF